MAQASAEKLEHTGRAEKERVASMPHKNDDAAASVRGIRRENARPEWVRSKRRAENPGIRKEEDELR